MAVGCLVQKCSAARQLQALTSIFATRLRLWNAGHSPTAAPNWILCGASQASRTTDEVIEYGTRTSDIVHEAEVPSRPTHVIRRNDPARAASAPPCDRPRYDHFFASAYLIKADLVRIA